MGGFSIWHLMILAFVGVVLFGGRGKISGLMGDFGQGLRSFREGMKDPSDSHAIPDSNKTAPEMKKADEVRS